MAIKIQCSNCEGKEGCDRLVHIIDDFVDLILTNAPVNVQRFVEMYARIPDLFMLKVYVDLSTSKVFIMEW